MRYLTQVPGYVHSSVRGENKNPGMKKALEVLKKSVKEGGVIERPDLVIGFDELNDLMGMPDILDLEKSS